CECTVVVVLEQNAGLGIDRYINVGPSIVVEIVRDRGDGISWPRLQDPGLLRNIRECAVSIVVVQDVRIAGKSARATHGRHALPLAKTHLIQGQWLIGIKLDEVAHEEIEMTIPVVIEKRATCAPPTVLLVEAGLACHIAKGSVSVVMEENVVTPERAEQVIPAIVVVVAHAHARLPSGPSKSGLLRHVREGAVAIVLEKMRGGFFPRGPVRIEP